MSDAIELLKKAAARWRACIELDDLHEDVLAAIRQQSSREEYGWSAVWIAAIPVTACVATAAVVWMRFVDPFYELINPFMVVMR